MVGRTRQCSPGLDPLLLLTITGMYSSWDLVVCRGEGVQSKGISLVCRAVGVQNK